MLPVGKKKRDLSPNTMASSKETKILTEAECYEKFLGQGVDWRPKNEKSFTPKDVVVKRMFDKLVVGVQQLPKAEEHMYGGNSSKHLNRESEPYGQGVRDSKILPGTNQLGQDIMIASNLFCTEPDDTGKKIPCLSSNGETFGISVTLVVFVQHCDTLIAAETPKTLAGKYFKELVAKWETSEYKYKQYRYYLNMIINDSNSEIECYMTFIANKNKNPEWQLCNVSCYIPVEFMTKFNQQHEYIVARLVHQKLQTDLENRLTIIRASAKLITEAPFLPQDMVEEIQSKIKELSKQLPNLYDWIFELNKIIDS